LINNIAELFRLIYINIYNMNKIYFSLFFAVIFSSFFNSFGQGIGEQIAIPNNKQINSIFIKSRIYPEFIKTVPQKVLTVNSVLPNNGFYSATAKGPDAGTVFQRTVYLITSQEFSQALFPPAVTLNSIGFNIYNQPPSQPAYGHLKVYFSNAFDITFNKPSDWASIISDMTLAEDDSVVIPNNTGTFDISFNGSPFTYSGGSVYIAFEWISSGTISPQTTEYFVNTNLSGGLRYSISSSLLPSIVGTVSNSRPETRLGYSIINDASVEAIYTLGNYPLGNGNLNPISAVVKNRSDNNLTMLNVTLAVNGTESYSEVKTLDILTPGATSTVTFNNYVPSLAGIDSITISVPNDNYNSNNSKSFIQNVNNTHSFSYFNNSRFYSSIGYSSGSGSLVVRNIIGGNLVLDSVTAFITEGTGKIIRGVAYNAAGSLIAQTNDYTIQPSDTGRFVTLKFNISPNITNQDIFVGIGILEDGYYPIGLQTENPTRSNSFFSCSLEGGSNTFSDLASYNYGIPMIGTHFSSNSSMQIFSPDGLNMPGDFTGWVNPPSAKAFSGIQNPQGILLPPEWKSDANVLKTRIYSTLINIRPGGDTTGGTYQFLFTSGPNTNYSQNKWGGVTVIANTIQHYLFNSLVNNSVSLSNGNYYTVNWIDIGYTGTNGIWMATTRQPVIITRIIDSRKPVSGVNDTSFITISSSKSPEENIFIRYTKDNWVTWKILQAIPIDSTHYISVIPGSDITANPDLNKYYAFTSTLSLQVLQSFTNNSDLDLAVISVANNGGAGFSLPNNYLPVELTSFTSRVNGRAVELNWSTASELGNIGFHIERNSGNNSWIEIGFREGNGTSSENHFYSFTDKNLAQ
jgi:hypothetical protein